MFDFIKAIVILLLLLFFYLPRSNTVDRILSYLSIFLIIQFCVDRFLFNDWFLHQFNFYGYGGRGSSMLHFFIIGTSLRLAVLQKFTSYQLLFIVYFLSTLGRFELILGSLLVLNLMLRKRINFKAKLILALTFSILMVIASVLITQTRTGILEDSVRLTAISNFSFDKIQLVGNSLLPDQLPIHVMPLGSLERVGYIYSLLFIIIFYIRIFLTLEPNIFVLLILVSWSLLFSFVWHPYYYLFLLLCTKPPYKIMRFIK